MARTWKTLALSAMLVTASALAAHAQAPDPALVAKGKALFADGKLSGTGQITCAGCHPNNGHTDNKTYVGVDVVADGDPKGRSTPTLWGAGSRSVYAWAGTAPTLDGNIRGIIVNRMKGPEPSPETLSALVAYVRSLEPPKNPNIDEDGTPTDKASASIKRGFELFIGDGFCGTCHVLPTFDKAETEDVNSGVGAAAKFKVPALRVVSQTAPYFNDGRYKTLQETVKYMWEFSTNKNGKPSKATDAQVNDLVAYLNAL